MLSGKLDVSALWQTRVSPTYAGGINDFHLTIAVRRWPTWRPPSLSISIWGRAKSRILTHLLPNPLLPRPFLGTFCASFPLDYLCALSGMCW